MLAALAVTAPPATASGWGRPFEFTAPGTLDLLPAQLAVSASGASAAGFTVQDVDTPGQSQAYVASRAAGGMVAAPRTVASAQQTLALSYDGSALELLVGAGRTSHSCCTGVEAVRLGPGGVAQRPRAIVGGLGGLTQASLIILGNGGMLASVATERGVWVVQASHGNRFGAQHRLTGRREMPQTVSSVSLGAQNTIVAWTAALGPTTPARSIRYALGTRRGAPRRVRSLLALARGHRIDELSLLRRGSGATAAWVESWYDRGGAFHSVVRAADVAAKPAIRTLSPAGGVASGLDTSSDAAGDQAVSFKTCRANGSCGAHVAVRDSSGTFRRAVSLGGLDASEVPATAVGAQGRTIVGWVRGGRPMASVARAAGARFGAARALSATVFAYDLTVAFGPGREAFAAWSQGTLNPSLVGAPYRSP